jgi:hypothetical protein
MPKEKEEKPQVGKVKLKRVRLSFPSLFVATSYKGSEPRYSATFILDKVKHKAEIIAIRKAVKAVTIEQWKKEPPRLTTPLREGEEKEDLEGYGEEIMFIACHSRRPIPVIDSNKRTLTESDGRPYSGCYVHASITVWAQDSKDWGKRINASLNAVMFAEDGESFSGGGVDVDEEFAEYIEEAEIEDEDEDDGLLG